MVTLWILLVVSMIEGFLEKKTNLPLPFRKFQEEVQEQNCDNTACQKLCQCFVNGLIMNKISDKYSDTFDTQIYIY